MRSEYAGKFITKMKKENNHPHLLSLNWIPHPIISPRLDSAQIDPESPVSIKRNLELDKLGDELFPSLTTGVRWWPFLCLALSGVDESMVKRATLKLKKDLKTNRPTGPSTKASFRPYQSMAKNIENSPLCKPLHRYLKGVRFDGGASFFYTYSHEEKWKELFLASNGTPAKGYRSAYELAQQKNKVDEPSVLDVVTIVLRNAPDKFDPVLWRGCYSFVFIRCLYGNFDRKDGEPASYSDHVLKWKDCLLTILKNPPLFLPRGACNSHYIELLNKIENQNSPPPLAAQTKHFRGMDRPVLAAMRIPLFHNLYFKSMPSQIKR